MTGILPINKGEKITSFGVVYAVRRITGEKKSGHTGTLDPMATGVLPVALGGATRFIELLPDSSKQYTATFKTGLKTDTLDIWGSVTEETGKTAGIDDIKAVLPRFRGEIYQLPPMYSAVKKDGERLYDLARKGVEVEREKRKCTVFSAEAGRIGDNEFSLTVECSSGTYIRTIIDDIGAALGCGAVMTSLVRTYACSVELESCVTLEQLEQAKDNGTLQSLIIPVQKLLEPYPFVEVTQSQGVRFKNGGELSRNRFNGKNINGLCRVLSDGAFLGVGELINGSDSLTVKRVYNEK